MEDKEKNSNGIEETTPPEDQQLDAINQRFEREIADLRKEVDDLKASNAAKDRTINNLLDNRGQGSSADDTTAAIKKLLK